MMSFYICFTLLTLFSVLLDIFFYPTFFFQTFRVDSVMLVVCHFLITLIFHKEALNFPEWLQIANHKFIFSFLIFLAVTLLIIEHNTYKNFVYTYMHLHPFIFIYIPLLSSILFFSNKFPKDNSFIVFLYIALFSFLGIYILSLYYPVIFSAITKEDGIFEYGQFVFFMAASFFSFVASKRFYKKKSLQWLSYIFILLGLALFFIAGEEISWGQRLFGISTPEEFKKINVQEEITVHNLEFFHYLLPFAYLSIGLYGSFARFIMEKINKSRTVLLLTPPYVLVPVFIIISIFYYQSIFGLYTFTAVEQISSVIFPHGWIEVIETFVAYVFFVYCYFVFTESRILIKKKF